MRPCASILLLPEACSKSFSKAIHKSSDAVLHECFAEVEQVPQSVVQQAQIRLDLLLVRRCYFLNRLEFKNEPVLYEEISPETLLNLKPLYSIGIAR